MFRAKLGTLPPSEALGAARAVYGPGFNPLVSLKALSYFGDGDLADLPAAVRTRLFGGGRRGGPDRAPRDDAAPRRDRSLTDLERVAARLVWWKPPAESLRDRAGLLAQVMVYGTPDDLAVARRTFPESAFRDVLAHPPPGIFDPRSWAYWHVVFGLEPPPDPPRRELPG